MSREIDLRPVLPILEPNDMPKPRTREHAGSAEIIYVSDVLAISFRNSRASSVYEKLSLQSAKPLTDREIK
jgi:hypothetical protein